MGSARYCITSKKEEITGKKLKRKGFVKKRETGDFLSITLFTMGKMQGK
jgi:hypothetical protein